MDDLCEEMTCSCEICACVKGSSIGNDGNTNAHSKSQIDKVLNCVIEVMLRKIALVMMKFSTVE